MALGWRKLFWPVSTGIKTVPERLPIEGQEGVGLCGEINLPPLVFNHDQLEALALGLTYLERVGIRTLRQSSIAARRRSMPHLPRTSARRVLQISTRPLTSAIHTQLCLRAK